MRVGLVEAVLLGDAVCDEEYGGLEAVGDIAGFAGGFGRGRSGRTWTTSLLELAYTAALIPAPAALYTPLPKLDG